MIRTCSNCGHKQLANIVQLIKQAIYPTDVTHGWKCDKCNHINEVDGVAVER